MAEAEVRSLSDVELVSGLTPEVREAFEKRCRWHRFRSGEQVMDRDDENRDVFFVVAGHVRIVNYSRSGREIAYASINPGGYFGELAAIDGQPSRVLKNPWPSVV